MPACAYTVGDAHMLYGVRAHTGARSGVTAVGSGGQLFATWVTILHSPHMIASQMDQTWNHHRSMHVIHHVYKLFRTCVISLSLCLFSSLLISYSMNGWANTPLFSTPFRPLHLSQRVIQTFKIFKRPKPIHFQCPTSTHMYMHNHEDKMNSLLVHLTTIGNANATKYEPAWM